MAHKYIAIDRILENVYKDQGYSHELDWGKAIEWAGRALKLIGAPQLYIEKTTGLDPLTPHVAVASYVGQLPVDFKELKPAGVRDHDTGEKYHHASDTFHVSPRFTGEAHLHPLSLKTYTINDSYIYINEETATLELAYRAIKTDDRGFPMIPDVERVIIAIESYITYRTDHLLWRQRRLPKEIYDKSEQEWLWYVASANTKLRTPHPDKADMWTKISTRLLPVIDMDQSQFAYGIVREDLNIGS